MLKFVPYLSLKPIFSSNVLIYSGLVSIYLLIIPLFRQCSITVHLVFCNKYLFPYFLSSCPLFTALSRPFVPILMRPFFCILIVFSYFPASFLDISYSFTLLYPPLVSFISRNSLYFLTLLYYIKTYIIISIYTTFFFSFIFAMF